jgi:aspartate aminotransferase
MPSITRTATDLGKLARQGGERRVSAMAAGLIGSEILKIAAEIRALAASGEEICNLTVGDFDPRQFPIPEPLRDAIIDALRKGETNYPPSNGVQQLREAVQRLYVRDLGLDYPLDAVLIAGGARPVIHATYEALCDPGDAVIYPVPSWNNNHYCHMVGAKAVPVTCTPENRFLPTADDIARHLKGARLVCLNSPLNPSGTAITPETLRGICRAMLAENRERETRGERPVYLMYDHVYWMLCVGDTAHVTPPELEPEMARYTIFVDGLSKGFAATGLRVGWAVGPVDVVARMSSIIGHVGAWAPRAEQVATAKWLDDVEGVRRYHEGYLRNIQVRLQALHDGLQQLRRAGHAVESIPPMGAIYLTARLHPFGKTTPDGVTLRTNEDVRKAVLEHAGLGIVPFQAFGSKEDSGWFRMSVGAVTPGEIGALWPRLTRFFESLR